MGTHVVMQDFWRELFGQPYSVKRKTIVLLMLLLAAINVRHLWYRALFLPQSTLGISFIIWLPSIGIVMLVMAYIIELLTNHRLVDGASTNYGQFDWLHTKLYEVAISCWLVSGMLWAVTIIPSLGTNRAWDALGITLISFLIVLAFPYSRYDIKT